MRVANINCFRRIISRQVKRAVNMIYTERRDTFSFVDTFVYEQF